MKTNWILCASLAAVLGLAAGCGDDDDDSTSVASGGKTASGGSSAQAGDSSNSSGGSTGSAGAPAAMCEPPEPPSMGVGVGGAGNGPGTGGAGDSAQAGASSVVDESELAIIGEYSDNFGSDQSITASEWQSGGLVFHIAAFSNAGQWIVAQNDQANDYNACLWSRFDWGHNENGALMYCQTAYDKESETAARAVNAVDRADPEKGCDGFAWTVLTAR